MHKSFSFSTTMKYKPEYPEDMAGITCFQNENFNYVFGVTRKEKDDFLVLARTENGDTRIIASTKINLEESIDLKVEANGNKYEFSYTLGGGDYINLGKTVSGDVLSTNVAGGFTGAMIGLYATKGNNIIPN